MASVGIMIGVLLALLGFFVITLRPTANPLAGRVLIGVGLLLILITVWEAAGHTGFHADQ